MEPRRIGSPRGIALSVAVFAALAVLALSFEENHTRAGKPVNRFVEVDGDRIAYRTLGPGRPESSVPLILCNRFRGTMDEWDPAFLEEVSSGRQVILFDYPGISNSSGEFPTSPEGMAAAVKGLAAALGHRRIDLLGFSMGGYPVQILAVTEPDLVRRGVLVGAGPFGGPGVLPPQPIFFETATKPGWDAEDRVTLFYGDSSVARRRGGEAEARIASQQKRGGSPVVPKKTWLRMVSAIEAAASPENPWFARLGSIRQPFLILNGDRDKCFPIQNQLTLYERIPDSQLAVLPMAGHAAQHQYPRISATLIDDFLR